MEKLFFGTLGLKRFSIYVQDYGAPVASALPRNTRCDRRHSRTERKRYVEGISAAFEPLKSFTNRTADTEKPVRELLAAGTTVFQYTHGAANPEAVSPDSYTFDQHFLDRQGNDAIQLDLFHNYPSNVALYDKWHQYFRNKQPRTLIVWGQNDPFFTVEGAKAFLRDLPNAEFHLLNAGHFALEEQSSFIAARIRDFLGQKTGKVAA